MGAILLLLWPIAALSSQLSPLATTPDWERLNAFQQTITHDDFLALLRNVYAPNGAADSWLRVETDHAIIQTGQGPDFVLQFAPQRADRRPVARYSTFPHKRSGELSKPLRALTIAIDPGHLGGEWAKMEERWFQLDSWPPVMEGNLTLRVAQLLARRLRTLGADVRLVRSKLEPLTSLRPEQLSAVAIDQRKDLAALLGSTREGYALAAKTIIRKEAERLFYRVAEIRERAQRVNDQIRPDLVVCLHFNAEPWGNPQEPTLVDANHLHLIINGAYSASELRDDDVRFAMLVKMLNRSHDAELALSESIAAALRDATGLPPFRYSGPNALAADPSGYIWARNLLANRLYECPVIYIECYVMNSRSFFERFLAGEYSGQREFDGVLRPNIFDEYANGIVEGLVKYVQPYKSPCAAIPRSQNGRAFAQGNMLQVCCALSRAQTRNSCEVLVAFLRPSM